MPNPKRPQILFLVHRIPYPPNRGDRIRSYHMLRFLSARADVHLVTLADEAIPPDTVPALRKYCRDVFVAPLSGLRWLHAATSMVTGRPAVQGLFRSRALGDVVRRWRRQTRFDAVVVYCSSMVQYFAAGDFGNTPLIVDLVDVDSQKFFDYAATSRGPKRLLFRLEGALLRRLEKNISERADAVVLVSESEAELFRRVCPNDHTHAVTNGVDLNYFQPADHSETAGRCVFVGALDYRANVDGLLWFCRHVWPGVRHRNASATLSIVGRNPGPEIEALSRQPGIEVVGSTPDVRPHLAEASLAVVPLRIARGIQNKVLEAMAMRRAVVTSPQGLEGLSAVPGEHLAVAESTEQWVREILRLLVDGNARDAFASAGRIYVETHHDWNTCLAPLDHLLGTGAADGRIQAADMAPWECELGQMAPHLP